MYVALDIGGTYTRVGLFDSTNPNSLVKIKKIKTEQSYRAAIVDLENTIADFVKSKNIKGIGISIASPVDDKGIIIPPNIEDWQGEKPGTDLSKAFDCPVMIINDGIAGAMAEVAYGESEWTEFAYIIWGTGVGGVSIKKNDGTYEIFPVGENHTCLHKGGRLCKCGLKGCIEAYIGGGAIEKHYKKSMKTLTHVEWEEILEHATDSFHLMSKLYKTKYMVINGGTVLKNPNIIDRISEELLKKYGINLHFKICKLGDEASLYGALISLDPHII